MEGLIACYVRGPLGLYPFTVESTLLQESLALFPIFFSVSQWLEVVGVSVILRFWRRCLWREGGAALCWWARYKPGSCRGHCQTMSLHRGMSRKTWDFEGPNGPVSTSNSINSSFSFPSVRRTFTEIAVPGQNSGSGTALKGSPDCPRTSLLMGFFLRGSRPNCWHWIRPQLWLRSSRASASIYKPSISIMVFSFAPLKIPEAWNWSLGERGTQKPAVPYLQEHCWLLLTSLAFSWSWERHAKALSAMQAVPLVLVMHTIPLVSTHLKNKQPPFCCSFVALVRFSSYW